MDFQAKKKFGQNFLVNRQMQEKVVDAMRVVVEEYPDYQVIEVGPGKGDLTRHILNIGRGLKAFEIDPEAVEFLSQEFSNNKGFEVIEADFLNLPEDITLPEKFVLLSNLPFNVGSRILVDLAIHYPKSPFCVILQKEVAKKTSKNSDFTFFGAWLNLFWQIKYHFDISAGNFSPHPKVCSGLITGRPKPSLFANSQSERELAKNVLKKLFANPKKTVFNNVKNLGWSTEEAANFFAKNNLDLNLRLTWDNYEEVLSKVLPECSKNK